MPRTPTHSFMCLNPLKPGRPYNMGIVIGCEAPPVPRDPITTISVFFFFFNKNQNQIELRKHTSYEEHSPGVTSTHSHLKPNSYNYPILIRTFDTPIPTSSYNNVLKNSLGILTFTSKDPIICFLHQSMLPGDWAPTEPVKEKAFSLMMTWIS